MEDGETNAGLNDEGAQRGSGAESKTAVAFKAHALRETGKILESARGAGGEAGDVFAAGSMTAGNGAARENGEAGAKAGKPRAAVHDFVRREVAGGGEERAQQGLVIINGLTKLEFDGLCGSGWRLESGRQWLRR